MAGLALPGEQWARFCQEDGKNLPGFGYLACQSNARRKRRCLWIVLLSCSSSHCQPRGSLSRRPRWCRARVTRTFNSAAVLGLACLVSCAANCNPGKKTLNTKQQNERVGLCGQEYGPGMFIGSRSKRAVNVPPRDQYRNKPARRNSSNSVGSTLPDHHHFTR